MVLTGISMFYLKTANGMKSSMKSGKLLVVNTNKKKKKKTSPGSFLGFGFDSE